MSIKITATAINGRSVIDHTITHTTIRSEAITYEQVGMAVMDCVNKARALQFYMLAPDMSIKVEFKHVD